MTNNWQHRFKLIPAVFIIVRKGKQMLLLRRKGTGYMDGYYSLPAGHVDGDERAVMAAIREAKEEIGLNVAPNDMCLVHTMHEKAEGHERLNLGFEILNYKGEPRNMEPDKCDELRWASLDKLPENIVPSVKFLLEQIEANNPYSDYNFQ
ncbi:MAG: NUDIX hydrolase [Candidatus Levyibacteriota bacterium]